MADLKMRSINNGFERYKDSGPMNETRVVYFHLTHPEMTAMEIVRDGDICYVASNDSLHLRHSNGTWKHIAIQENLWTGVNKTVDETVTSSTTLHDDATLHFSMTANTKYQLRGKIFFDTVAAADFKWRHSGPAAPALIRIFRQWISPGQSAFEGMEVDTAFSIADLAVTGSGTTGGYVELDGLIHNGPNTGDFVIQWAQNSSNAGATTVRAGSYLEWRLLA